MKPMSEPPGPKRLKLNCEGPLSNFAVKLKLRRYTKVDYKGHYKTCAVVANGGWGSLPGLFAHSVPVDIRLLLCLLCSAKPEALFLACSAGFGFEAGEIRIHSLEYTGVAVIWSPDKQTVR